MTFEGDASMPVRGTLHVLSLCSRDIAKESSVDSSWSAAAHLGCGGFILVRGKGEPDDSSTMLEAPFHTRWPRRTGEVGIKGAGSTSRRVGSGRWGMGDGGWGGNRWGKGVAARASAGESRQTRLAWIA